MRGRSKYSSANPLLATTIPEDQISEKAVTLRANRVLAQAVPLLIDLAVDQPDWTTGVHSVSKK